MTFRQVLVLILDGFGVASPSEGNAITAAGMRNLNGLINHYSAITLQASGPSVGLPWGERGNSEVGHLNLGAGRIVYQDLPRISAAIASGEFYQNLELVRAMEHAKKNSSRLHLAGLVSDGGVHSSEDHLYALLALAADRGIKDVNVHMFTDGRDTAPKAAPESLDRLNRQFLDIGVGRIATMTGRFYAMDRGGHWEVTEKTYRAMVLGEGERMENVREAINEYYGRQIFDEMFPPTVITGQDGQPSGRIQSGDAVVFFNFRPDRVVQLARSFVQPGFDRFSVKYPTLENMFFCSMTQYEKDMPLPTAFPPIRIDKSLAELVSQKGWSQFHLAEREKYAHVTSFFNGGREEAWPGEIREIVSSPASYKERYADVPEMSARAITGKIVERLAGDTPFIVANFANADMVGHTGNKEACKRALVVLDECLGIIAAEAQRRGAAFIITADHGNVEQIVDPKTGTIDKEHSMNPVPFILVAPGLERVKPWDKGYAGLAALVPDGVLSDLAPTVLELFGLPKSAQMTAVSLLPSLLRERQ